MNPFWIKTADVRLAITPRPKGEDWLLDDLRLLKREGIDLVASSLTPAEAEELGLLEEGQGCQSTGLEYLSFPIEDRSVPSSFSEFDELLKTVSDYLSKGRAVGVSLPCRDRTFFNDCRLCFDSVWILS